MSSTFKKEIGALRNRKPDISNLVYGKVPPHVKEIEEAVLGAIMLEKDKLPEVLEVLPKAECFYIDAHQRIFSAILRLPEKGQVIDLHTIAEELRKSDELELVGGEYFLAKLTMGVVSSAHVVPHARIVMEKYILRKLIQTSGQVIGEAYEDKSDVFELLDKAETDLFDISNNFLSKQFVSVKDVIIDTLDQISKDKESNKDVTGVTSGFPSLDAVTAGWQKTDLIILAARPSVGKTAFALNLALNAAIDKEEPKAVAVFSLEMSNTQLVKRLLSNISEVPLESINRGRMEEHEFRQLTMKANELSQAKIFIDDQAGLNIFELRAKCRRLKSTHDIQLIIIDYLQLMHAPNDKGGNREQEISKISRELKALAKELDVPVIALSQLSRAVETRGGDKAKIPQLSDLRESGAIEQDADMVMFIYRPEYYGQMNDENGQPLEGETHINIAKHRNGRLDTVKLKAELKYQRFVEFENTDNWQMLGGGFDNPQAGIRKHHDDLGGSSVEFTSGFQTMQSKANDMNFDDDFDAPGGFKLNRPPSPNDDDDIPF